MLIHAAVRRDLDIRLADQSFKRRAERAGSGIAGEIDGDHHPDPKCDREHRKRAPQQIAAKRAQNERAKQLPHTAYDRSTAQTRPSRICTRVDAIAAASALWVAIRIVVPNRSAALRRRLSTWSPLALSRLPVGSSAIRISGE